MKSTETNSASVSCEQFQRRMDRLLDLRQEIASDPVLREHASRCAGCERSLEDWTRLESVASWNRAPQSEPVSVSPDRSGVVARSLGLAATLAAIFLVLLTLEGLLSSRSENRTAATIESAQSDPPTGSSFAAGNEDLDAAARGVVMSWQSADWWASVTDEPWVHQTLPAMHSVGQGVAPIGRSMKQALVILITPDLRETPHNSSGTPAIDLQPLNEQTSILEPLQRFTPLA